MSSKTEQEDGASSPGQSSRERQGELQEQQQPQTSRLRQDEHQHQQHQQHQHQHQYQHRILLPRWPPVPLVGSNSVTGFVQSPPSVVGMPTTSTMMEDHGPSGNVRSLAMMPTLTSMQQAVNAIAAASQGYGMVCGPGVHQAPVHPQWPPPGLLPGHPFNMAVELVAGAGDGARPEPSSGVSVESARGTGDDGPLEASSKGADEKAQGIPPHAEDKASLPEATATSPEQRDAEEMRTPTRTRIPRFDNWKIRELREYAFKLASWEDGKKVLRYGPGSQCVVRNISRAAQADLARAMRERAVYRMENNEFPEWEYWPPLTPEKDRKIRGKAVKKSPYLRKNEFLVARMICIMASDDALFRLFVRSGQVSTHCESDRGATDKKHEFYLELAKALATIGWRNSDGKPVSVPRDHGEDDPPAPSDLLDRLSRLDLEQPAYAAREVVEKDSSGNDDFTALQGIVHSWISSTRADHKEMRDREDMSDRAGADREKAEKVITIDDDGDNEDVTAGATGDGDGDDRSGDDGEGKRGQGARDRENGNVPKEGREQVGREGGKGNAQGADVDRKDSKHTWDFCRGRLSVFLWNDMIVKMTGEDGVADIIPDIVHGSCGSVPGGAGSNASMRKCEGKGKGRRSCEELGETQREGGRLGQKRRKEKKEAYTERFEPLRTHPSDMGSDGRSSPTREELADDIKRLSRKIRESEREEDPAVVIDTYRDLLSEKIKELHAKSAK